MPASAPKQRTPWPRLGRVFCFLGNCGLVVSVLLYIVDILYSSRYGRSALQLPIAWLGLWSVALLSGFISVRLTHWGRRMQVLPGAEVLARDRRPPILYLRSFRDDPVMHTVFDRFFLRINYRTEEEE